MTPVPVLTVDTTPHELVVVKPAGLASELPRDSGADSLVHRLEQDGFAGLRLVHRLDAPACGLVVVARSAEAAAHYAREIEARHWHKWYVARVGMPPLAAASLVGPHKAYLKTDGRSARVVRAGGKPSFLDVVCATEVPGDAHASDVLIRLHTGRFHQIRAMLAHAGAPLVGDTRYGGRPGAMYLEHVMLGARRYGAEAFHVWRAPAHDDRPAWAPAMVLAVDDQSIRLAAQLAAPASDAR